MTTDALLNRSTNTPWDFSIQTDGDIETVDFFDTSLLVSLFGEQRANSSEVAQPELRRGWLGNESTPDFEQGSKLWLYRQARLTRTTINGIITTAENSMKWLVDDGLAKGVRADVRLSNGTVLLDVFIERFDSQVEHRFFELWENSGITEG